MSNTPPLTDNPEAKQYEMIVEGQLLRIEYIKAKGAIYLTHTEVPVNLEGQGWGSTIIEAALRDIEKIGLKLFPLCPFVAAYIKKNPEWKRIVKDGVNIG